MPGHSQSHSELIVTHLSFTEILVPLWGNAATAVVTIIMVATVISSTEQADEPMVNTYVPPAVITASSRPLVARPAQPSARSRQILATTAAAAAQQKRLRQKQTTATDFRAATDFRFSNNKQQQQTSDFQTTNKRQSRIAWRQAFSLRLSGSTTLQRGVAGKLPRKSIISLMLLSAHSNAC